MIPRRDRYREAAALTLVEVLAAMVVLVILAGLFWPPSFGCKVKASRIMCTNNLKQMGLSFHIFAADHHGKFPMERPIGEGGTKELTGFGVVFPHFLAMSNELSTPKILVCSDDNRSSASNFNELRDVNLSYFVGLDSSSNAPMYFLK